jgi:hypothetical protein
LKSNPAKGGTHTISATLSLKDVFVVPGGEPRAGLKLPIMGHVQPLAVETVMVLSVIEFIQSKAAKNSPHQSLNAVKRNAQQALSVRPMELYLRVVTRCPDRISDNTEFGRGFDFMPQKKLREAWSRDSRDLFRGSLDRNL